MIDRDSSPVFLVRAAIATRPGLYRSTMAILAYHESLPDRLHQALTERDRLWIILFGLAGSLHCSVYNNSLRKKIGPLESP